jgi:integrase
MASIYKTKSGTFRACVVTRNGRRVTKTFSKKTHARMWATELEADHELQQVLGSAALHRYTLADLIDAYRKHQAREEKAVSRRLNWWEEQLGELKLIDVDTAMIREALKALEAGGKRWYGGKDRHGNPVVIHTGKPLSGATLNRYKACISSVFAFGMDSETFALPSNPCRGIRARRETDGRTRFLSDNERTALLAACKASRWPKLYLLVSLALVTGARRADLIERRWRDIDFQSRRATVARTKNGQPKVMPLTLEVIQELMKFRGEPDELVFAGERLPDKPAHFRSHWERALAQARVHDFRFHDLRHTTASMLAANGATLAQIAEVLGHKSINVTRRYSHLCIDHKQTLIDSVMGNFLKVDSRDG